MADGSPHPNTIRAGAFLLTTALLALVIIIVLAKTSWLTRKHSYVIHFQMTDGVAGLERGAEVRVSGLKVGRVTDIHEKFDEDRIDVVVEMDATIKVFRNAEVLRSQALLGNYSWLNFPSLGGPPAAALPDGGELDAKPSGGLLATLVGPQNAGRANQMFDDLAQFTGSLRNFADEQYPKKIVPILDDATTLVASARKDYEVWRGDIGSTLKSASSAAGKLDTTMDDAKVMVSDARAVVAHFREKNLSQVDAILDEAQAGTTSFANALQTLDTELATRLPDIRAMLADLRTAAAQVKLATMEVRRSPWKLLYKPSGDELTRENLYEAARAFALASSDLRVAGETLQAALRATPERWERDPAFRQAVQEQVTTTLGRYEAAQKKLFDVLLDGQPVPAGSEQVGTPFAAPAK